MMSLNKIEDLKSKKEICRQVRKEIKKISNYEKEKFQGNFLNFLDKKTKIKVNKDENFNSIFENAFNMIHNIQLDVSKQEYKNNSIIGSISDTVLNLEFNKAFYDTDFIDLGVSQETSNKVKEQLNTANEKMKKWRNSKLNEENCSLDSDSSDNNSECSKFLTLSNTDYTSSTKSKIVKSPPNNNMDSLSIQSSDSNEWDNYSEQNKVMHTLLGSDWTELEFEKQYKKFLLQHFNTKILT